MYHFKNDEQQVRFNFAETRVLIMEDMLVFLEEKDKKYSLLSLDQKVIKCYVLASVRKQLTFRHATPFSTSQKHYSDLGCDTSLDSMEFLRVCLRRHVVGKPVVAWRNAGCFLRLCIG